MKDFLRGYFHYSKTERNGFLVLAFLCLFAFLLPTVYRYTHSTTATDFSSFQKEIQAFAELKKQSEPQRENQSISQSKISLFDFDPNTASAEDLQLLGLPKRVVNTLINFRNKGGRFNVPEDLKKVYGLSDEDYHRLKNYTKISEDMKLAVDRQPPANNNYSKEEDSPLVEPEFFDFDPNVASQEDLLKLGFPKRAANNLLKFREKGGVIRVPEDVARIYGITEAYFSQLFPFIKIKPVEESPKAYDTQQSNRLPVTENIIIDVNAAGPADWQKLKGIGPKLSGRIVNFRDRLGGFHELKQVGATYGLPDSVFRAIQPYLQLTTPHQKIKINTVTKEDLAKHPYLNKKQAGLIINYRLQHGSFNKDSDLRKMIGLPNDVKDKIVPYLSFE